MYYYKTVPLRRILLGWPHSGVVKTVSTLSAVDVDEVEKAALDLYNYFPNVSGPLDQTKKGVLSPLRVLLFLYQICK
ncbi:hypothetical protein GCM10027291_11760 [Telluribacter humicola]